jgi:hypothetical protein
MNLVLRRTVSTLGALLVTVAVARAAPERELTHRVWLLGALPDEPTVTALIGAGVRGFVLPVGSVEVVADSSRFTLAPLPDLKPIARLPVTALVWVEGAGKANGDAAVFAAQFAAVARSLPAYAGLILAAHKYFPGLPGFASGVAHRLQTPVELALSVGELSRIVPLGGWADIEPVAVALGDPPNLGFAASTLQDDLAALDRLDASGCRYRAAIVVAPLADPSPGAGGASLATLADGEVASYRPGAAGDAFVVRRRVVWGSVVLDPDQRVTVAVVGTARYDRDLGLLLRPVRSGLDGWDTVGLPAPEPALGMSREAFLDYLNGAPPYPQPEAHVEWSSSTTMGVSVSNPTAQGSAIATIGNWVELRFSGSVVRDVHLGGFGGIEYGRIADDTWQPAVPGNANALRLYLPYMAPRAQVGGAVVTFLTRPSGASVRWRLRLDDGSDVTGPLKPVASPGRPR